MKSRSLAGLIVPVLVGFLLLNCADAKLLVYEGFQIDDSQSEGRSGWAGDWGLFEGEAIVEAGDLEFSGLKSASGWMELKRDTVTVCQIAELHRPVVYGSFRIYSDHVIEDALLGFAVCEPDASVVRPDIARMSLQVKCWRSDLGAVSTRGNKQKVIAGTGIESGEPYLVLFKVVNPSQVKGALTMWLLNAEQVAHLSAGSFDESLLSEAPLGDRAGQISQRVTAAIAAGKLPLMESGLMLCLINRFNAGAIVDEIRISDANFAEAVGLETSSMVSSESIPYISK